MIYCIGDSHASFFTGKEAMTKAWPKGNSGNGPYFRGIRIGPMSAHNLLVNAHKVSDIAEAVGVGKEDYLMLPHGSADCRVEIPKLLKIDCFAEGSDNFVFGWDAIKSAIKLSTNKYMEAISFFAERYRVIVWGVIGAGVSPMWSNGTQKERNAIAEMFNFCVQELCDKNGIPFVCVFDEMVKDGITKDGWLIDDVHLNLNKMPLVIEKFREAGLI